MAPSWCASKLTSVNNQDAQREERKRDCQKGNAEEDRCHLNLLRASYKQLVLTRSVDRRVTSDYLTRMLLRKAARFREIVRETGFPVI